MTLPMAPPPTPPVMPPPIAHALKELRARYIDQDYTVHVVRTWKTGPYYRATVSLNGVPCKFFFNPKYGRWQRTR